MRPSVAAAAAVASRVAPALILVVVAVWEIVVTFGAPDGVPGDAAWARAAEVVRAEHRDGELIVFAPRWVDPVGRLHLGDRIPLAMAGRLDGTRYPVIWELSIRGARAPETAGLRATSTQTFGGVTVRRFEQAAATLVTDLVGARTAASGDAGAPRVEALAEVGFEPHRCAQVQLGRGDRVTLAYEGVELGSTLVVGVGLADVFTRRDERSSLAFAVAIDGADVITRQVGVMDGWWRRQVTTEPGAHDVEVRVAVPATIGCEMARWARRGIAGCDTPRLLCFAAEARTP